MKQMLDRTGLLGFPFPMYVPLIKNEFQTAMSEESTRYEQVCKSEFSLIPAKLDRMDEAIRGNADPLNRRP